jgi:hypothetical protein
MKKEKLEFVENVKANLDYLIKDLNFELTEEQRLSVMPGKTLVDFLIYKNEPTRLLLEIVIYTSFYITGIESYVRGIYVKKMSENGLTPTYTEKGKCYIISDIKKLIPTKTGFFSKKKLSNSFIEKTLSGQIWPDFESEETYIHFTRHTGPAYIEIFKEKLKELLTIGYEIVYDESELPPYEQSFLNSKITYEHKLKGIIVSVNFQARDQEFYVSSNVSKMTSYERACDSTFEKLKNEMIEAINKSA